MPDLLLLDDFGLRKLTAQQSSDSYSDSYDVLVERHRRAATIITSDRAVDEWVALFDGPILANRSGPRDLACPLQKGLAQTMLMP